MNWFRNAKTSTKLLVAFGLLAALLGVVGFESLRAADTLNGMLNTLYQRHMVGAGSIQDVRVAIPMIGREIRQLLLQSDPTARELCARNLRDHFAGLEESMTAVEKNLVTEEGKATMAKFRRMEQEYRGMIMESSRLGLAGQDKAALENIAKTKELGEAMRAATASLVKMKDDLGKKASEESDVTYAEIRRLLLGLVISALAISIVAGITISRMISRPLSRTVEVLSAVSERDLTRSLKIDSSDEIGEMAQALNRAVGEMREAMLEVKGSSEGVATAAEQLAAAAEELSSGTQQQASSQEETSSSLQELSTAVKQNAENARQASQLASGAREAADNGGAVVNSAVTAMAEINASSKRIADIISAIDEIAFQTNLLALNAAVEAARAGEQGRGFAVVASEVRNLAQRSATAAKEIKTLIQDSVRKVEAGSELVNRSGHTLSEIVTAVKRVTDIVGEIAAASREQAVGIEQVTKAMAQMDQVTQTNSAQTEELSSTSQTLATHALQMQSLVSRFTLGSSDGRNEGSPTSGRKAPHARTAMPIANSLARLSGRVTAEEQHSAVEAGRGFESF